jgi:hypothetical protein
MKANCPAVVQALDPFWHWYRPALVEQNEFAAPVVGGVVEQAEMPEPVLPEGGSWEGCACNTTAASNAIINRMVTTSR